MPSPIRFSPLRSRRPEATALGDDEIHLWACRLDISPERVDRLASVLSTEEQQRAARFRFSRHRRRFRASWGSVRALLAAYTETSADEIVIRYGPKGKPGLHQPETDLRFNLSHSGDQLVLAVGRCCRLGVDIERLRPMADGLAIARRFFSPQEVASLEGLPEAERTRGFFNCWTRKEALIKAVGDGVFVALDRFDVSLRPDEPARLLALDGDAAAAATWSLLHFEPAPDVVGALATEQGSPGSIQAWTLDLERQLPAGID